MIIERSITRYIVLSEDLAELDKSLCIGKDEKAGRKCENLRKGQR
jgi:hypothetical protein